MTRHICRLQVAGLSMICFIVLPLSGQNANNNNNNGRLPGANNAQFTTNLKAQFEKADLDKDGFLDKDELAKAFRGPKAKAPTQGMYDDQGHLTKTYYDAPKKYPDLVLLWAADKDNDDRLSWTEYRDYEVKLQHDRQQQLLAMQRNLQSTNRRTSTQSRRYYGNGSRNYSRNSGGRSYGRSYSHYGSGSGSSASYLARSMMNQQMQMVQAARNWQLMQMQAVMNYQRAYQQAMMMRLAQQQMANYANYYARMRQVAAHRVVQRHYNPAPRRRR